MPKVTLNDMLIAKEVRKNRQDEMRQNNAYPIVSITINMPGQEKDSPILRKLRDYAVGEIRNQLEVIKEYTSNALTGPEAILAVKGDAKYIKALAVAIEEQYSFTRLLDIDVFSNEGQLISRHESGQKRKCLICNDLAVLCMREGRHNAVELSLAVRQLIDQFSAYLTRFISPSAEEIGALAVEAMLYEVSASPSPGLVDRVNNGAHKDMDFYSFMSSTASLGITMARCAQAGMMHEGKLSELLPILRWIGREGEVAMFSSTYGVNTQKGLLFSLGITAAAAGFSKKLAGKRSPEELLEKVAEITEGIVERELKTIRDNKPITAGEKLYQKYGITGIRGELEQGIPTVRDIALPALRKALTAGLNVNDVLIQTLLEIIANIDDTTVMNRHNPDKMAKLVRPKVRQVLSIGGMYTDNGRDAVFELDREFICSNISPGGAADLLAVTWFVHRLTASTVVCV
ncbi:triphosphoribosyl-dephospho-CoA synthase CitG [Dendrosporobacter sp. 1207_IL3150]|uniref:triphosphoribosyl-dephospho-CoA synthase CitG n=1 Tax=Dendrosporobacter sp. 1207_IL3150 TaxID=3084054 RepID=UPI002FDA5196